MPVVYFIRHAESTSNIGEKTHDPNSIPLTPHGEAQARHLAAQWDTQAPGLIVASPYLRAQQTADPLRRRFAQHTPFDTWPVQEFTYLTPSAQPSSQQDRLPRINTFWQRADPDYVDGPGAESFNDMLQRIDVMIESLKELRLQGIISQTVVVFTHGQIMHFMRMRALSPQLTPQQMMRQYPLFSQAAPIDHCAMLRAELSPTRFQLAPELIPPQGLP